MYGCFGDLRHTIGALDALGASAAFVRVAAPRESLRTLVSLLTLVSALAIGQDELDADQVLKEADAIRFPRESFETLLSVTNYENEAPGIPRTYRVMSRGNDFTVVLTEEPASERGQALLMRERDLWIFLPSVSQPVRLSLSQRLTGQVANGDLARANFAGDYDAERVGSETINGADNFILELTAKGRNVTYSRVRYWIQASNYRPTKAEFYAVSGRLLKTALYDQFREIAGRERPTRLILKDAIKTDQYSVLEYEKMEVKEFPDRLFTRQYLRRL